VNPMWRILETLLQGGWVMIPLAVTSVAMWVMILERYVYYRDLDRGDLSLDESQSALADGVAPDGPGLRARLIDRLLEGRTHQNRADVSLLRSLANEMRSEYENRLPVIEILAAVAPLLGLLGTVLGMIETFGVISIFGTGNPRALAGGISVALITTQAGLLVAIPGMFIAGRLRRAVESRNVRLEETVVVLTRQLQGGLEG
jgi:biopolymer transport protein ExbB